jgi:hypothetical protein
MVKAGPISWQATGAMCATLVLALAFFAGVEWLHDGRFPRGRPSRAVNPLIARPGCYEILLSPLVERGYGDSPLSWSSGAATHYELTDTPVDDPGRGRFLVRSFVGNDPFFSGWYLANTDGVVIDLPGHWRFMFPASLSDCHCLGVAHQQGDASPTHAAIIRSKACPVALSDRIMRRRQ